MFSIIQPRVGDIIGIKRRRYSHFGIYSGRDRMIHYSSHISKSGDLSVIGKVTEDLIFDVAGGSDIVINNLHDSYLPVYEPDKILNRAKDRLGESNYNLFSQNCEHLATEIRYGVSLSSQISVPPWQPDEDIAEHYKIPMIFDESLKDNDNHEKPPIKTVGVESEREQCDDIKDLSLTLWNSPCRQILLAYMPQDQSSTLWNISYSEMLLADTQLDQSSTLWNISCSEMLLADTQLKQTTTLLPSTLMNSCFREISLSDAQHNQYATLRYSSSKKRFLAQKETCERIIICGAVPVILFTVLGVSAVCLIRIGFDRLEDERRRETDQQGNGFLVLKITALLTVCYFLTNTFPFSANLFMIISFMLLNNYLHFI